jgi:hypothetical protein
MAKPSILPRWGDTAAPADVVAPNSSKQGSGWSNGELPPHTYFNWWQNLVYQWIQWLNGLLDTANAWTARQTFSGGATVVDPPVNGTDAASKSYVDTEAAARAAADTAEAAARVAADTAEATARAAADALLMPKTGGTFSGTVTVGSGNDASALTNGGLELTSANALIDFKDLSSEDYDARIIKPSGSNLEVVGGPLIVPEAIGPRDAVTKGYVDAVPRFVVAGRVRGGDGFIVSQTGTVTASGTRNATGAYTITVPGLTGGAIVVASQCSSPNYAISAIPGSGSFIVNIAIPNTSAQDSDFSFVVLKL